MSTTIRAFRIAPGASTVTASVTAGSATLTIPAMGTRSIRVYNEGTNRIHLAMGPSGVAATTTTSAPMAPGSVETFEVRTEDVSVAFIATTTGNTIWITPGDSA